MADARDRFLYLATRPLAENPEIQIHARNALVEKMDPAAPDAAWQEAADSLERYDRSGWARRWGTVLLIIVLIGTSLCVASTLWDKGMMTKLVRSRSFDEKVVEDYKREVMRSLPQDQQLILYGDVSKVSASERLEALCARYPDDPVYYADYAMTYVSEHKALPPEYLTTAARIDPDNGWFPCFAAGVIAKGVVQANKQTAQEEKDRIPRKWSVLDQPHFEQSLDLFRQGCQLPRFESYQRRRVQGQLALLPPAHDTFGQVRRLEVAWGESGSIVSFRSLVDVISAEAQFLGGRGDREALERLMRDWKILLRREVSESTTFMEQIITQLLMGSSVPNFKESATALGMHEDAARLEIFSQRYHSEKELRKTRNNDEKSSLVNRYGGEMEQLTVDVGRRVALDTPPLDVADLTNGRLADHALDSRIYALCACGGIAIISILCAVHRFRHGLLQRRLSERLRALLQPADWLGLFAAAGLPALYYQALYHLTPLGGRDEGHSISDTPAPMPQMWAWLILTLVCPLLIARWRIRKRLPELALGMTRSRFSWPVFILGCVSIPLFGVTYVVESARPEWLYLSSDFEFALIDESIWTFAGSACLLLVEIWWLILFAQAIFGRQERGMGRLLLSRMLVPAYLFGLMLFALSIPAYRLEERHWVERDAARQSNLPDSSGRSRYEDEFTKVKRAELLEMLSILDKK